MAGRTSEFEFDIALSFAGEDRKCVELFARLLRAQGLEVFYDEWETAELWGRDLYQHLIEVYSKKARFCVIFISAQYAAKAWTRHELKAAQSRAFRDAAEYILPIRLDDTVIPGILDTVGYLDLRQSSIEEVAEIAIQKTTAAKAPSRGRAAKGHQVKESTTGTAESKTKETATNLSVDRSIDWVFLADTFHRVQSVERPDDKRFIVTLLTTDAKSDAQLDGIPRGSSSKPTSFAYANDAFIVRCDSAAATYASGAQQWKIVLIREDFQYGGHALEMAYSDGKKHYTAEDIARIRAERILLGSSVSPDPTNSTFDFSERMLEVFIQGMHLPLKVTGSPIQALAKSISCDDPELFLNFARLLCLFYLKAGGVVERIERLALGPLKNNSVHVEFRGLRRKKYSNVEPEVIELNGDCLLA